MKFDLGALKSTAIILVLCMNLSCSSGIYAKEYCDYYVSIHPHRSDYAYVISAANEEGRNFVKFIKYSKRSEHIYEQKKYVGQKSLGDFCDSQLKIIEDRKKYISIDGPDLNLKIRYRGLSYVGGNLGQSEYVNSSRISESLLEYLRVIGISELPQNPDW